MDVNDELLTLDTRNVLNECVVQTVRTIQSVGQEQNMRSIANQLSVIEEEEDQNESSSQGKRSVLNGFVY